MGQRGTPDVGLLGWSVVVLGWIRFTLWAFECAELPLGWWEESPSSCPTLRRQSLEPTSEPLVALGQGSRTRYRGTGRVIVSHGFVRLMEGSAVVRYSNFYPAFQQMEFLHVFAVISQKF